MVLVTYRPLLLYKQNSSLKIGYFTYPSHKSLSFRDRKKIARGISDPIKTGRVIKTEDFVSLVRLTTLYTLYRCRWLKEHPFSYSTFWCSGILWYLVYAYRFAQLDHRPKKEIMIE